MLTTHPIENHIISLLSTRKTMSTDEIHSSLTHHATISISRQQLYRIIGKMADAQILAKKYGSVTLHTLRVKKLLQLANTIEGNFDKEGIIHLPRQQGETKTIVVDTMNQVRETWQSIICMQHRQGLGDDVFSYSSHGYLWLGAHEANKELVHILTESNYKIYNVIGNDSALDKHILNIAHHDAFRFWSDSFLPLPKKGFLTMVVNDITMEVSIPQLPLDYLSQVFENTQKMDQFDAYGYEQLLHIKAPITITLTKNQKAAHALKRLLSDSYNSSVML